MWFWMAVGFALGIGGVLLVAAVWAGIEGYERHVEARRNRGY